MRTIALLALLAPSPFPSPPGRRWRAAPDEGARRTWRSGLAMGLLAFLAACDQDVGLGKIEPTMEVTPDPADIGDVLVGGTASAELTLTHITGGDVEVLNVGIEAVSGDFFTFNGELPVLGADDPATMIIDYAPTEEGFHEASVTLTYNNGDEPSIIVSVRGHGVIGAARVYPNLLDFGNVGDGNARSKSVTVVNDGDITLPLGGATFTDDQFSLNETLPFSIEPGESQEVSITFSSTTDSAVEATGTLDFGEVSLPDITLRANDCERGDPSIYDEDSDGYTTCGGDCDDGAADTHPGGDELEDGKDQDCDGIIDEGTNAYDDDGDGFSENDGDCNDADTDVDPAEIEDYTNGIDDDCDGTVDGGTLDSDGDGYGDTVDCDDADASTYPDAPEAADNADNDCDGIVDEGTDYYDDDADGQTEAAGDCDDADDAVYNGATERADYQDNDCDGATDEGTSYADDDGDGFTETGGDCNDANANVNPAQSEVMGNGVDDDCNGTAS